MKINIRILSLIALLALSGCTKGNDSSNISLQNSSTITNEVISGVEIAGASSVYVGKSIKLVADVLGSDNDDVTWTSSDNNIATVDNNGTVVGISEGNVIIRATSIKDNSKFADYSINVLLPKATGISVYIEDNSNISYDSASDTYTVPLGQTFYIDTKILQENTKTLDISYTVNYPSGTESQNTVALEIIPETTRAKVICYQVLEGLTITSTGKYNDFTGQDLKSTLEINVVDKNVDKFNQVKDLINSFKEAEVESLVSSTLKRTKTTTIDNNITKVERLSTHKSFLNATYVNNTVKTFTNNVLDNEKELNYYQGSNTIGTKTNYYAFEYDNNQNIVNLFDPSKTQDEMGLIYDVYGTTQVGYTDILLNILTSSTKIYEGDIASLSDTYIYAYAEYEINTSSLNISSSCLNAESNVEYETELAINHTNNKLNSYTFTQTINNGTSEIVFKEEASNFVYETKKYDSNSNEKYIDINQYYVSEFDITLFNEVDPDGKYDYSNTNKYGANKSSENGLVKYSTTYDKTIILKADVIAPSTANINLDKITAVSSNTDQIPNVTSVADGIFAINAKKDDNSNSLPGKATFTFSSTTGVQKQIVIEFVEATLSSVNANFSSNINITHDTNRDVYVFDPIFEGDTTSYFMINATPDESKYTFDIDVVSGDKDGINLYQFGDINKFSYPRFSYAIEGVKAGTYQFKIFVNGYGDVSDERLFEITVEEPYSADYIKENIVGKSYEYKGFSMITTIFTFETETTLKYVETDLSDNSIVETILSYHIEKGKIIIDSTQNFTSGSYFSRLSEGLVYFSRDFSNLQFYIETYSDNQLANTNFFNLMTFTLIKEPIDVENIMNYINGKTFISTDKCAEISFNNGNGSVNFYNYGGTLLATFTFTYSYDSSNKALIISNTTSSSTEYELKENSSAFDSTNQVIEIKIAKITQYGDIVDTYKFEI